MFAEAEQIYDNWQHVENEYNDNWCVSKKVWFMMLIYMLLYEQKSLYGGMKNLRK